MKRIIPFAVMVLAWDWAGSVTAVGHVWREGPGGIWSKITDIELSAQSYTDTATTLKVGAKYCYKVCAGTDQTNCTNVACAIAKDK